MYLYNDIIVTPLEIRIAPEYTTDTKLAIDWFLNSDGNYYGVDYDSDSDVYETEFDTYGTNSYISNIETELNSTRASPLAYMSGFAADEYIFGQDIDYSDILSGLILDIDVREHTSLNVSKLHMKMRLFNPTFTTPTNISGWLCGACIKFQRNIGRDVNIVTYDTYDSKLYCYDTDTDIGFSEVTYTFSNQQLADFRYYVRTIRTDPFRLVYSGCDVATAFGPVAYYEWTPDAPYAKLIDWKEYRISPIKTEVKVIFREYHD